MRRDEPPDPPRTEWCEECEHHVIKGQLSSHSLECSHYQEPPEYCSICNPPPNEDRRVHDPVFCSTHDREDWKALIEHAEEQREEEMRRQEERYKRG